MTARTKNKEGFRVCCKCRVEKELSAEFFHRHHGKTSKGFQGKCKKCCSVDSRAYYAEQKRKNGGVSPYQHKNREYQLRHHYGLKPEDVPEHCEVCGSGKKICVDHCHRTGRVRGFLCDACNITLGKVKDNPTTLRRLAEYLEKNENSGPSDPNTDGVYSG